MKVGNQTQALRDFVLYSIPCTLAVPVLVAILESDLDRLEAINKILIKLDGSALDDAINDLNQAVRDLGLRRSGFFSADDKDDMWFSFAALPHGAYRHRQGTLHIHSLNGEGELFVLSPAARHPGAGLVTSALSLKSTNQGVVTEAVDGAAALAQIRTVLAAAIAESEMLVH
ncbi:hypothetical protein BH11CYA1_BH11CYA1_08150 [soil metagenome]